MKTLIATTGNGRYLLKVWLPTLRQRGEYNGDILILDYDYTPDVVERLQEDKNILLRKVKKIYDLIPCDRFRAFSEVLKDLHQNYDVIMTIDMDTEFFKPIQPLFDMAQEKIRYVKEWVALRAWFKPSGLPNIDEIWKKIESRPIINSGMIVGPTKLIYETTKFIAENLKYKNSWGYDQMLLNIYLYCFDVPSQNIDEKWNYILKGYLIVGKVLDVFDNEIAILHKRNV